MLAPYRVGCTVGGRTNFLDFCCEIRSETAGSWKETKGARHDNLEIAFIEQVERTRPEHPLRLHRAQVLVSLAGSEANTFTDVQYLPDLRSTCS